MQIQKGKTYTFNFSTIGSDPWTVGRNDALLSKAVFDAGFPVSVITGSESGGSTGYANISMSFVYNGQDTDSDTLGNAMQDAINSPGLGGDLIVTFESADSEDTTGSTAAAIDAGVTKVKAAIPNPTTLGIGALFILLLVVAVFAFSESVGARVGA